MGFNLTRLMIAAAASAALCSCSLDGQADGPAEGQMKIAMENMLAAATYASAKENGISDPTPFLDKIVAFKKRECIQINEDRTFGFLCSFDAEIQTPTPTETGTVESKRYGGSYTARFINKEGFWIISQ